MRRTALLVSLVVLSACGAATVRDAATSPGAGSSGGGSPGGGASGGGASGGGASGGGASGGGASWQGSSGGPGVPFATYDPSGAVTTIASAHTVGAESFLVQVQLVTTATRGVDWSSGGASSGPGGGTSGAGTSGGGTAGGGGTGGGSGGGGATGGSTGGAWAGLCAVGTTALGITSASGSRTVTCVPNADAVSCPAGTHSGGGSSSSGGFREIECVSDDYRPPAPCPEGTYASSSSSSSGGGTLVCVAFSPGDGTGGSSGGSSGGSGVGSSSGASGTGTAGPGTSGGSGGTVAGDGAQKPLDPAEPDTIHAVSDDGRTLYALDALRGLQILDLASLDAPVLLGRVPVTGSPRDLHVRGTTALLTLSGVVSWTQPATAGAPVERTGSQVWLVDVATPSAPRVTARIDLAGALVGTRLVGDILYAVTRELAVLQTDAAWSQGLAHVWSLDVSGTGAPRTVTHLAIDADRAWAELTDTRITIASLPSPRSARPVLTFRFLDLASADGAIRAGAVFEADGGLIDPRWMHWDAGRKVFSAVVRSGPGAVDAGATLHLWSSPTPGVAALASRTALAAGELLTQAALDGTRAYVSAMTADTRYHAYVVDTTDPARPVVSSPIVFPGPALHMEARGDRLLAVARAYPGPPWSLSLLLVDGTTVQAPRLLASVVVGTDTPVGIGPTDDPRTAFQVLDAEGLVAVPALGYGGTGQSLRAHVALVDLARQGLTARARLPHPGRLARVAALPGRAGQLALVSARQLATVDATDRAAPRGRATLELSTSVVALAFAGGKPVTIEETGATTELRIAAAPGGAPLARLAVTDASRLHVAGSIVWVLGRGGTALTAVDVTDPVHPRIRSTLDLVAASRDQGGKWGCEAEHELAGTALVVHRVLACSSAGPRAVLRPRADSTAAGVPAPDPSGASAAAGAYHDLLVFDLAAPDAPRLAARVALPGQPGAGLTVSGGFAWLTHFEPDASRPGWGRFFADRVGVAAGASPALVSVNVPGVVVGADPGGDRVYVREPLRWERLDRGWTDQTDLHALALTDRGTARLVATATLPGAHTASAVAAGHVYAVTSPRSGEARLSAVDLATMSVTSEQPVPAPAFRLVTAGGKLFLSHPEDAEGTESALVLDLGRADRPAFEGALRAAGWPIGRRDVVVEGGVAFLPSGPYGVRSLEVSP